MDSFDDFGAFHFREVVIGDNGIDCFGVVCVDGDGGGVEASDVESVEFQGGVQALEAVVIVVYKHHIYNCVHYIPFRVKLDGSHCPAWKTPTDS